MASSNTSQVMSPRQPLPTHAMPPAGQPLSIGPSPANPDTAGGDSMQQTMETIVTQRFTRQKTGQYDSPDKRRLRTEVDSLRAELETANKRTPSSRNLFK